MSHTDQNDNNSSNEKFERILQNGQSGRRSSARISMKTQAKKQMQVNGHEKNGKTLSKVSEVSDTDHPEKIINPSISPADIVVKIENDLPEIPMLENNDSVTAANTTATETEIINSQTAKAPDESAPKRRGRPRNRIATASEYENLMTINSYANRTIKEEKVITKRQSSPRPTSSDEWPLSAYISASNETNKSLQDQSISTAKQEDVTRRRKRSGNKSLVEKSSDTVINSTAKQAQVKTEEIKVPRRRGRPRVQPAIEEDSNNSTILPTEEGTQDATKETELLQKQKIKVEAESTCENSPSTPPAVLVTSSGRVRRIVQKPDEETGEGLSDEDNNGVTDDKEQSEQEEEEEEEADEMMSTRRSAGRRRSRRPGRGRGRGKTEIQRDIEYVPRVGTSAKSNKSKTTKTVEKNPSEDITCGKCKMSVSSSQWSVHNISKHCNMAWIEGTPEPDYLNDLKMWRKVLIVAHKRKRGVLVCDKCGNERRSVDGFISHYRFCGVSEEERETLMWICPRCHGVYMPSSQDVHERLHREADAKNEEMVARVVAYPVNPEENTLKRKAAERAATKIHEFTKLVKASDEPPAKKLKIKQTRQLQDLIEFPKLAIPSAWKSAWLKDLAAKKAITCRQVGCTFEAKTLEIMTQHQQSCKFIPEKIYHCKVCKYHSKLVEELEDHIRNEHPERMGEDSDFHMNESSDETDDDTVPDEGALQCTKSGHSDKHTILRNTVRYEEKASFLKMQHRMHENHHHLTYIPALRWTLDFEADNYQFWLFDDLKPNKFELLTNVDAEQYLPELRESMQIKQMSTVETDKRYYSDRDKKSWQTCKLFESTIENGISTFFAGGPVWAMAWMPIPAPKYSSEVDQFLAVSTHKKMEDEFVIGQSYKFKNLIQLWNMGHLNNDPMTTNKAPHLAYAIVHDRGTIWAMEWCPSGAYEDAELLPADKSDNLCGRMGLLATASSDGLVHIYSMPFPDQLNFSSNEMCDFPIYKTNPVATLHVNHLLTSEKLEHWQCVSLCWNKILGHDKIVAGFTNGYVAIWNLTSKSALLVNKIDDTININASKVFFAHGLSVTFVTLVPLKETRYLVTASQDRLIKYWDLEDTSQAINEVKTGAVNSGTWLTNWSNIFTAFDDCTGREHNSTHMNVIRDPHNKTYAMLPARITTYGLASSDYANGVCHGTLAGEMIVMFPFQLLYLKDLDRLPKRRWPLSTIEVIDFDAVAASKNNQKNNSKTEKTDKTDYEYSPETYDRCKDRYGMVFRDNFNFFKNQAKDKRGRGIWSTARMSVAPVEQYNFTSINRISWNPNAWSYLWIANGYQNGLIRVLRFKTMSMQNAMTKLLPKYVEEIMGKKR